MGNHISHNECHSGTDGDRYARHHRTLNAKTREGDMDLPFWEPNKALGITSLKQEANSEFSYLIRIKFPLLRHARLSSKNYKT